MFRIFLTFLFLTFATHSHAETYSQYILYKSGAQTLPTSPVADWRPPSSAYTAITIPFPFDRMNASGDRAASASVQIVWAANSAGGNTGVRLLACPAQTNAAAGPVACSQIAFFAANDYGPAEYTPGCVSNPGGAMPCRADVTTVINNLIQAGTPVYLAISSYGNGINGPLIWDVELLISWRRRYER